MSALSNTELAVMREIIEKELLPDTCSILSLTTVSDGQGGQTQTWGTASTVACRLDMQQGREQVSGGALQPFTSFILSLPWDTTIAGTDRVEHNGVTYAVTSVNTDQSWIAVKRCVLEKV